MPEPAAITPWLEEMHANRWYTNFGPLNRRFEKAMQAFFAEQGTPGLHVGTFSSATTGLELVLRAMQVPEGGKVLVPSLTFPATALAVKHAGLVPVLADVDPDSWELTPDIARRALAEQPFEAIMPVAAFGKPVPAEEWRDFQQETGVPVILDAAAVLGQQPVPEGVTAVFSLHATKPFGVGEGGLVVTSDEELLTRARSLSNFGFLGTAGVVQQAGTNAKFGEYYAAVGLAQLKRWSDVLERRKNVADMYRARLAGLNNRIRMQAGAEKFVPAVLPIYIEGKGQEVHQAMANAAIQTRRWYLPLLHLHPALTDVEIAGQREAEGLIAANRLAEGLVGLPFHAFLSENDIDKICKVLAETV